MIRKPELAAVAVAAAAVGWFVAMGLVYIIVAFYPQAPPLAAFWLSLFAIIVGAVAVSKPKKPSAGAILVSCMGIVAMSALFGVLMGGPIYWLIAPAVALVLAIFAVSEPGEVSSQQRNLE